MSNTVERFVYPQLISCLTANDLHIPQQSGFRRGHSTETALLNVVNIITSTLNSVNTTNLKSHIIYIM